MVVKNEFEQNEIQKLLKAANIGWWKADFKQEVYICSDFLQDLLGLKSDLLPFWDFYNLIRDDYKNRISSEFATIKNQEVYEQTFPIFSRYGEKWIHSKMYHKEKTENGQIIAYGFIQCIDNPETQHSTVQQINELLYRQHSISRSLLSFMQTKDIGKVIRKILEDILIQFQGSRVYIFQYNKEGTSQKCTYEVVAPEVSAQQEWLQDLKLKDTPWATATLKAQRPIILYSLNEMPAAAQQEKEILVRQGIKSLMIVPMASGNKTHGYLGIDIVDRYRNWQNEDYQWLASLANIISLCLKLLESEKEAQIEREYFRDLYIHMPIAYIRFKILYDQNHQLVDYRFIDLNPAFEKLTGKPIQEYLNRKGSECISTIPFDTQLSRLKKIFEEGGYTQMTYQNKAETVYFRVILYAASADEVICFFSDITETFKAHKALDHSEKTLRNLFANIPVGIEIYDRNGVLKDLNEKDMSIFGLKEKKEALGVTLFENPNFSPELKQQFRNKEDMNFELKYDFSKVNHYYTSVQKGIKNLLVRAKPLYDEKGNFENYILIIIDNTDTLSAHNRIQNFENFFSLIAGFAKIGYFKWNPLTKDGFAISQWYKNLNENEDTPMENIIGIYAHLHPEDAQMLIQGYKEMIAGKITSLKKQIRVITSPGNLKWLRCNITVKEYDPAKNNIELIGVNFDITETKAIETELIEAKNKAETLDKLKSAFLANMSHEIRTPLNAIVGFSSLLVDTQDTQEQQEYLSIIQKNSDLLLQLISDILDLSKIESGTFEFTYGKIDVNNLCAEIIQTISVKANTEVELIFGSHLPVCIIESDKNRLTQIITNFINNALKFTSSGSITLSYTVSHNFIKFSVTDTGIGIPPEKQKNIFERFVKLNTFVPGTGLGLSICKNLVEQMGGQIGVESEEGKGSCFWFCLPYIHYKNDNNSVNLMNNSEMNPENAQGRSLILVAEDTDSNFLLISTILKKDYEIVRACNGIEAVEKYKTLSPALILMDIKMPLMDGLEATRQIRALNPQIPIIAITAFAFDSDRQNSLQAGCSDYLTKPISPQLLRETLKKYMN